MTDTAGTSNFEVPAALVSSDWAEKNLANKGVRFIESNEDQLLYRSSHIPGAVHVDWIKDLNHQLRRDYLEAEAFSDLASRIGITPETLVVFYGDKSNWWACFALWVFSLFGHKRLAILDGGRLKWEMERRPLTKEIPDYPRSYYPLTARDDKTERAFRDVVLSHQRLAQPLIDVRSPEEFSGERLHMENYPNEGALRGGHIPGAINIPWSRATNPKDGTFLPEEDLRRIYQHEAGLKPDEAVITYCRIGERSSHTWFVLKFLLGFSDVKNYDGSWTEWGNLVGVPIEKTS